jgi:tetratricopeptide (TPR) repeat protein
MAASVLFAHARYSDAVRIAALPEAPPNRPILRAARLYALGEAAARRGDLRDVRSQSAALRVLGREAPRTGEEGQRTRRFTEMARLVLEGRAAMLERRWTAAAASFDRAADLQQRLGVDGDPPFFWFNIRRAQAAALTEAGRLEEARSVAFRALKDWPKDAPTLAVLAEVHRRAGRPGEAAAAEAAARRSWAGDPAELRLSRA